MFVSSLLRRFIAAVPQPYFKASDWPIDREAGYLRSDGHQQNLNVHLQEASSIQFRTTCSRMARPEYRVIFAHAALGRIYKPYWFNSLPSPFPPSSSLPSLLSLPSSLPLSSSFPPSPSLSAQNLSLPSPLSFIPLFSFCSSPFNPQLTSILSGETGRSFYQSAAQPA